MWNKKKDAVDRDPPKKDIKNEVDLETDLETDPEKDLEIDQDTGLEINLKTGLETDPEIDLETDLKTDLEIDPEIDLETDLEIDLGTDLETDLTIVVIDLDLEITRKIKMTPKIDIRSFWKNSLVIRRLNRGKVDLQKIGEREVEVVQEIGKERQNEKVPRQNIKKDIEALHQNLKKDQNILKIVVDLLKKWVKTKKPENFVKWCLTLIGEMNKGMNYSISGLSIFFNGWGINSTKVIYW